MELLVERLLPDGRGAGVSPEGRAVRVTGGLPGDRVTVSIDGEQGRTIDATVTSLIAASPDRRPPPCPFDAACGGCDVSALVPEARRRALAQVLAHAYEQAAPVPIIASPRQTAHRARIKLAIDANAMGYRQARSHTLAPIDVCAVARPEIQAAMPALAAWLREMPLPHGLASVELRSDGAAVAFAFESRGSVPRAVRDAMPTLGDVALDGRRVAGDPRRTLDVSGLRLQASPLAFYQVNLEVNALLVQHVVDAVLSASPERVLDLYAGNGNLSLAIARAGLPVIAVESEGQATADLAVNAERAGLTSRVRVVTSRVERFDPTREAFDAVVLDPPRAGATGVLAKLLTLRPRVIVAVSCFAPATARDLRPALAAGYHVRSVTGFEMFPDTHHVESVVVLTRR